MARLRRDDRGERRTGFVGFRVTPVEEAELAARAGAEGRDASDFCRSVLLSPLKAPAPSARDAATLWALRDEICGVGNHVNHHAHLANERRLLPTGRELAALSASLRAIHDKATDAGAGPRPRRRVGNGGKGGKRGRRTAFVGFYVTPAERAELAARAAAVGCTLSSFCRMVLLSPLQAPAPRARDPHAVRAIKVEISRVGNNFRQLRRVAVLCRAAPTERELASLSASLELLYERAMTL
jgi:hypothetical protein